MRRITNAQKRHKAARAAQSYRAYKRNRKFNRDEIIGIFAYGPDGEIIDIYHASEVPGRKHLSRKRISQMKEYYKRFRGAVGFTFQRMFDINDVYTSSLEVRQVPPTSRRHQKPTGLELLSKLAKYPGLKASAAWQRLAA